MVRRGNEGVSCRWLGWSGAQLELQIVLHSAFGHGWPVTNTRIWASARKHVRHEMAHGEAAKTRQQGVARPPDLFHFTWAACEGLPKEPRTRGRRGGPTLL